MLTPGIGKLSVSETTVPVKVVFCANSATLKSNIAIRTNLFFRFIINCLKFVFDLVFTETTAVQFDKNLI